MPPKLYVGERHTLACIVLHQCAQPRGAAFTLVKNRYRQGAYSNAAWQLAHAGLVEQRASGPRGGQRWHTTKLGDAVLWAVDHAPEPHASLMLLGVSTKIIGKNSRRNPEGNGDSHHE